MQKTVPDILFSSAVRAVQDKLGSSGMINRLESLNHWKAVLSTEQIAFIQDRDSFYFGTASKEGRPYIQHRGGTKGFIHIAQPGTLWFPDFAGNRQYITTGNLSENNQAFIFLMDYPNQRRLKLWGRAYVHEKSEFPLDPIPNPGSARIERVIRFEIEALDENCRQHILPRYLEEEYMHELRQARQEIAELKARIKLLEETTHE